MWVRQQALIKELLKKFSAKNEKFNSAVLYFLHPRILGFHQVCGLSNWSPNFPITIFTVYSWSASHRSSIREVVLASWIITHFKIQGQPEWLTFSALTEQECYL
jgi:hypothetical protein